MREGQGAVRGAELLGQPRELPPGPGPDLRGLVVQQFADEGDPGRGAGPPLLGGGAVVPAQGAALRAAQAPGGEQRGEALGAAGRAAGGGGRWAGRTAPAASTARPSRVCPGAAGAAQTVRARRPPGRRTRRSSATAAACRPTWLSTKLPTTASNARSAKGSSGSVAARTSTPGALRRASASMLGSASTAVTRAPRAQAAAAAAPVPVPTSSTVLPGPTRAASRSAGTGWAHSRAKLAA